jgi:hypothetical protein
MRHDLGSTIRKGFVPNCGPNGSGFVTWTAHASTTCGRGKIVDGPRPGWSVSFCGTCMFRKSVSIEGRFGGNDATITIQQTGPATFATYAHVNGSMDVDYDTLNAVVRHDTLEAAKADANARYRTVQLARAARRAA